VALTVATFGAASEAGVFVGMSARVASFGAQSWRTISGVAGVIGEGARRYGNQVTQWGARLFRFGSGAMPQWNRAAPAAGRLESGGMTAVRQLGQQGELAAGIVKNTERIASTMKPGTYRVPDVLDHGARVIGEVKNVGRLAYTSQLRDFTAYAQQNGYQFQLWVRPATQLSRPLSVDIVNGNIILKLLP
jgi:Restriction endonuclease fold toxin 7